MPEGRLLQINNFSFGEKDPLNAKNPDDSATIDRNDTCHRCFYVITKYYGTTLKLVGKSLSALCTTSLENVSAVCGLHSLSEAMLLFSLTLFGLVSSEHSDAPP